MIKKTLMAKIGGGVFALGLVGAALVGGPAKPAEACTPPFCVLPSPALPAPGLPLTWFAPNLKVIAVSAPSTASDAAPIPVTFTIRNTGSATATNYWTSIRVDGVIQAWQFEASLAPGTQENYVVNVPNPAGFANRTVLVTADHFDSESELLESDNTMSIVSKF